MTVLRGRRSARFHPTGNRASEPHPRQVSGAQGGVPLDPGHASSTRRRGEPGPGARIAVSGAGRSPGTAAQPPAGSTTAAAHDRRRGAPGDGDRPEEQARGAGGCIGAAALPRARLPAGTAGPDGRGRERPAAPARPAGRFPRRHGGGVGPAGTGRPGRCAPARSRRVPVHPPLDRAEPEHPVPAAARAAGAGWVGLGAPPAGAGPTGLLCPRRPPPEGYRRSRRSSRRSSLLSLRRSTPCATTATVATVAAVRATGAGPTTAARRILLAANGMSVSFLIGLDRGQECTHPRAW